METLVLAVAFSLAVGAVLGLLGGGGGILAVPLLVYIVGVGARPAIAMSLLLVGATSALGALLAARAKLVQWRLGALFGAGSMVGAFAGGRFAAFIPESVLLGGLATVMLATALAMLRARPLTPRVARDAALVRVLPVGALVGLVSGVVGAGGGFLIVPALTMLAGMALRQAIGTSLFIIALQSFAGFAGHIGHVTLDARLVAFMTAAAMIGVYAGSAFGKRCSGRALTRGFAAFVLATGLFVLAQQIPLVWMAAVTPVVIAAALMVARKATSSHRAAMEHKEQRCITSVH
jgi:uncharacterized membrane protein YfcA